MLTRCQGHKQAENVVLFDSMFASVLSEDCKSSELKEVKQFVDSPAVLMPLTREALIDTQKSVCSLTKPFAAAKDVGKDNSKHSFLVDNGFLMLKWVS